MTAGDFLRNLYTDMNAAEDRAKAFQAQAIGTQNAGLVTIQRVESTLPDGESYGRLTGFATADQDYVLCLEMRGGGTVVLGPLQNTTPSGYTLDAALSVSGGLINSDNGYYVLDPAGQDLCNQTGDVASTTGTATYAQAMSYAITLPAGGTFDVGMWFSLDVIRTPAGNANIRGNINGTVGGPRVISPDVAISTAHPHWHATTGIAGGSAVTFRIEYHGNSGTGVTTSAKNPMIWPRLRRMS